MFRILTNFAAAIVLSFGSFTAVSAQEIAAPQSEAILTLSGELKVTNVDGTLQLDREALMGLASTTFETSTIWTEGVHTFEGVSLQDLVDLIGVEDGTLRATAINDYTVEIPVSDAVAGGPMIAYLMDGAEMSVRDKGPLWIIYPFDSSADYRSEVVFSRSIWQLDRIEVVQ